VRGRVRRIRIPGQAGDARAGRRTDARELAIGDQHGIEHRLTKPYHPWTNGQAERMNRTIKDATVKVFHYEDLASLKAHVLALVTAYNVAKHLKSLRGKTPFQTICLAWIKDPDRFMIDPHHLIPGPYTVHNTGQVTWSGRVVTVPRDVRPGSPLVPGCPICPL
jgi:hypothetical protein